MKQTKSPAPVKITKARRFGTAHRAAVLANLQKAHEAQRTRPRCGAQRRSAEGTCGNLALENGRCRLHGGRTPKGKDWHKVQLTNPGGAIDRLVKKEAEVAARRERQEQRRRAMSPEQREAHEAWRRAHRPGPAVERQRTKAAREARILLQDALGASRRPESGTDDARALAGAIQALEAAVRASGKGLTESAKRAHDTKDTFE